MYRNILLLACIVFVVGDDELYVQVKNGVLRGRYMETRGGRRIHAFTSIPFAEPPVGDLRFKAAVPAKDWTGVKDATQVHAVCPQRNVFTRSDVIEGSEDCLYLNVYKPQIIKKESKVNLLPVMVFFHGGGWLCGSGNTHWYGPDILLDRDIILVVPNFRLGALGFLSTGDDLVPGNNGLKDQVLALKWVQENIEKFGGDPNSVTIFGESAGGASVHLHMLSTLSKGLFHNGISESGTALCPWAFDPNDLVVRNSKHLAKILKCPSDSSKKMVECLKKIDPYKIMEQDKEFMLWDTDPIVPFRPTIEPKISGAFIDAHPTDLIKAGNVNNAPWMLGFNSADGGLRSASIFGVPSLLEDLKDDFNKRIGISLQVHESAKDPQKVSEEVRRFYLGNSKVDASMEKAITKIYTDGWFLNGIDQAIVLHRKYAEKNPIYYYLFAHRGVASFTEIFGDPHNDYGVCHADELQYLFPVGDILFPDKKPDEADKNMAKIFTTLFTDFAKYGDPTPKESIFENKWEPVTCPDVMEYYNISSPDDIKMEKGLYMERAKFWRNLEADVKRAEHFKDEL